MPRPLLLLDVDGVLSLFGFAPDRRPDGHFVSVDGIPHLLGADCAAHVNALHGAFEVVWCTGWEEKADEHLPHVLGVPRGLAHLSFEARAGASGHARHWKLDAIDAYAGPHRPLAWVDDGHDDSSREWAGERAGPTLLVQTDPATGITAQERDLLLAWAGRQNAP